MEIPRHPIGAAQIHFGLASIRKKENSTVLQKTAHNAAHMNPAADPTDTGAQRATAANDQFDINASLRGRIKRLNDFLVEKGIDFREDERGTSRERVCGFPLDQADAVLP